ncbi:hypothetical protein DH2020_009987 [Rehmannia glutinosa]|uniref:Branchpoint-bridging protein n=1 Tax=Rehmannia glutinosa TaxID=99300 RepID=A0ABR0X8G4_REHGL
MDCDPYRQHCNADNENHKENNGEEICQESDEDPEEMMEEEPEEDPEEEVYEESDEDPEEEIEEEPEEDPEEEIDGESEEDPEEEIVEEEDSEDDKNEESDEEELEVENSHLSSAMSGGMGSKDLGNELDNPEDGRGKKVAEKIGNEPDGTSVVRKSDDESRLVKVFANGECTSKQQEHGGSSGKRRQSRWDIKQEGETPQIDGTSKRRKTRWENNDSQNGLFDPSGFINLLELSRDPHIIRLRMRLTEINKKLQSPEIVDERPAGERSPSPEPVYNNLGIRINTRDARIRKKLTDERTNIISKLASAKLTVEPAKEKSKKFVKKLFVPVKEYPTYNFIGLILGPKGNTQKKMEKETGAKIFIRGKGSGDPESDDEDLHVRVEATNKQSLNAAAAMVEKLLIPVADGKNDHKRAQLQELAKLRGTYNDTNTCELCKEQGHRKYACPLQDSTFKAVCCDLCGSFGHPTSNCTLSKSNKEVDPANLYVSYLPPAIDDKRLKELFLPFGRIERTAVMKDLTTGLSKGYGFVKYENPSDAAAAVMYMNGYKMDGRILTVRVAGPKPVPGPSDILRLQAGNINASEAPFSTLNNQSSYFPPPSSYPGHNINVARTEAVVNVPPFVMSSTVDPRMTSNVSSGYDFCDKILIRYLIQCLSFLVIQTTRVPSLSHTSLLQE